jgi:hypothetical protein
MNRVLKNVENIGKQEDLDRGTWVSWHPSTILYIYTTRRGFTYNLYLSQWHVNIFVTRKSLVRVFLPPVFIFFLFLILFQKMSLQGLKPTPRSKIQTKMTTAWINNLLHIFETVINIFNGFLAPPTKSLKIRHWR